MTQPRTTILTVLVELRFNLVVPRSPSTFLSTFEETGDRANGLFT